MRVREVTHILAFICYARIIIFELKEVQDLQPKKYRLWCAEDLIFGQ
jgi:hypothetical protein